MPYIPGGGKISDVYHSTNVYANNVPVALWQPPGASAAFASDVAVTAVPSISISVNAVSEAASLTSAPMPADAVAANAIESSYQGTPTDAVTTSTGAVTTVVSTDFVGWMAARIDEGNRGMWTRQSPPQGSGPAVSPGNTNITGIWTAIGLSNYASNDQTAWCMGFVNFALKQNGYVWCSEASAIAIKNKPERWNATPITDLTQGQPGDIALWNYSGHNHVNLVYTASDGKYTFCGGNQNGKSVSNNPQNSCVSQSWPGGYHPPGNGTLIGLFRPSQIAPFDGGGSQW